VSWGEAKGGGGGHAPDTVHDDDKYTIHQRCRPMIQMINGKQYRSAAHETYITQRDPRAKRRSRKPSSAAFAPAPPPVTSPQPDIGGMRRHEVKHSTTTTGQCVRRVRRVHKEYSKFCCVLRLSAIHTHTHVSYAHAANLPSAVVSLSQAWSLLVITLPAVEQRPTPPTMMAPG
jgi:hypothetical protein